MIITSATKLVTIIKITGKDSDRPDQIVLNSLFSDTTPFI